MRVTIKEPGPGGMRLIEVPLDMSFAEALGADAAAVPDAYERLIMDVIRGNQTLFMRGDEVEAAWSWTDPIIEAWNARGDRPKTYEPGSTGPEDAMMLLHRDGRRWRRSRNEIARICGSGMMMIDVANHLAGELNEHLMVNDRASFAVPAAQRGANIRRAVCRRYRMGQGDGPAD